MNWERHDRRSAKMTAEHAATLKRLAEAVYELEAFQPNLTLTEADLRIAMAAARPPWSVEEQAPAFETAGPYLHPYWLAA